MAIHGLRSKTLVGASALALLGGALAACSSSGSGGSGSGGGGGGDSAPGVTDNSITVGLMTSLTGPTAAGFTTVKEGFEARIALQNAEGGVNGRKIKVVLGDDQGSTQGATTAARTLVEQDHVFAVGDTSIVIFAAQPYLTQKNVPVVGPAIDGPEWAPPNDNMFPTAGGPNPKFPAPSTYGTFFKRQGATNIAAVGNNSPSAVASLKNVLAAAKAAGLNSTYLNDTIPFTQEGNFGSIVQQMQQKHVDGIFFGMEPTADFALLEEMKQAGMHVKAYLLDLTPPAAVFENKAAVAAAQGVWSRGYFAPWELHTAATNAFQAALKKYENQTTPPDDNEYNGWAAASAIVQGLKLAGKNPTQQSFMTALRGVKNFTADGLLANPTDMSKSFGTGAVSVGAFPRNCLWYTQYKGHAWIPDPKPTCGPLVPNSDAG